MSGNISCVPFVLEGKSHLSNVSLTGEATHEDSPFSVQTALAACSKAHCCTVPLHYIDTKDDIWRSLAASRSSRAWKLGHLSLRQVKR